MNGMTFEVDTPYGPMMATMLAGIAQFERDMLSERVRSGFAAAQARGRALGRQAGDRPKSNRLAPKVMALVAEGRSYRWIAHGLGLSKTSSPLSSGLLKQIRLPISISRRERLRMKRVFLVSLIGVSLGPFAAPLAAAPHLPSIGYHPGIVDQAAPVTAGPYYLANAFCPSGLNSSYTISAPLISPDGRHFLVFGHDKLWIGTIGSSAAPRVIASRLTVPGLGHSEAPPFVWRNDSRAILGVRQDTMRPSGFALGPLWPIEIPNVGEPRPLPLLKNVAGGLDGILWVGGGGLAMAEFGTKGGHYRPEHDDPTPTLAIVDGRRGKVLQTVPMPLS